MFGSNYYGQQYFAQGPAGISMTIMELIKTTTRFIMGFHRSTKRLN
jgi:hypothetical protein